jgi:predicted RNase H-like nuclease (RuvC/YqgF family)
MMTAEIASLEKVRAAVERLHQQQKKVTLSSVGAEVGGGSRTTILEHLKTIRSTEIPASNEPFPSSALEAIKPAVSQIFAMGQQVEALRNKDAVERQNRYFSDLEAQIDELVAEAQDRERAFEEQSATVTSQRGEVLQLTATLADQQRVNDDLRRTLADLTTKGSAATFELVAELRNTVELLTKQIPVSTTKFEINSMS